jgi:hypothetical protein
VRTIATYDVPDVLVGLSCAVSVTSTNDESVHINNFSRIASNGDSLDVLGTEDGVNGVHATDKTLELGETIVVTNHIGARARGELPVGTSVRLTIGVTCVQDDTTTTSSSTVPPSSSTTTLPSETPTTSSTTTTTSTSTSTSVPATTTTAPTESTTTTEPDDDEPPASTIPPVTSPPTLPFTGIEDAETLAGVAMAASALLLLGGGVLLAGREGR